MTTELCRLRDKIDSVTTEMSICAAEGHWQKAGEFGELRQNLLETLIRVTDNVAEERALIQRILESDLELRKMAQERREVVSDELAVRRQRRDAVDSYRDAASPAVPPSR